MEWDRWKWVANERKAQGEFSDEFEETLSIGVTRSEPVLRIPGNDGEISGKLFYEKFSDNIISRALDHEHQAKKCVSIFSIQRRHSVSTPPYLYGWRVE